jgi:hypothetical protein
MIEKTIIDSFSQNKNLITRYENLKLGYLYLLRDRRASHIMLTKKLGDNHVQGDLVETSDAFFDGGGANFFNIHGVTMSRIPESHTDFKGTQFAFYEIGSKEDHPEFFL